MLAHRLTAASALVATLCTLAPPALAEPPPGDAWPPPGVTPIAQPPAAPPPPAAAPAAPPPPAPAPEVKKHGPRLPGVLLLALGAAGLGAGGVFGIVAMTKGASARSQCSGNLCPPAAAANINMTKNFEAASYTAFTAGGTIALTGLILTIVAPGKPEESARLAPWVGLRSAGLGFTASF